MEGMVIYGYGIVMPIPPHFLTCSLFKLCRFFRISPPHLANLAPQKNALTQSSPQSPLICRDPTCDRRRANHTPLPPPPAAVAAAARHRTWPAGAPTDRPTDRALVQLRQPTADGSSSRPESRLIQPIRNAAGAGAGVELPCRRGVSGGRPSWQRRVAPPPPPPYTGPFSR